MATKIFHKLKTEMYASDVDQKTLCKTLGRSQTYITRRMTGIEAFNLNDVYSICDLLDILYTEIPVYFPRGGK